MGVDTLSGWVTGTVGTNAEGQLVTLRARLRVVAGPDQGQEAILEVGTATIGTGRDAALRLTDRSVSRRHVELALLAGGARVRDLGSRNGTFSRGARIDVATLSLAFDPSDRRGGLISNPTGLPNQTATTTTWNAPLAGR